MYPQHVFLEKFEKAMLAYSYYIEDLHVLLSLLNKLRKSDKMRGLPIGVGIASENNIQIYRDFWVCIEI